MKMAKRITTAIVLLAMLFTLSGCDFLDDLRAKTAQFNTDGTLEFKGKTYLPFEDSVNFYVDIEDTVYISTEDEPLLWMYAKFVFLGYYPDGVDKDGVVISTEDHGFFVREDMYDSVSADVDSFKADFVVGFEYDYYQKEYLFTESEYQLLMSLTEAAPADVDYYEVIGDYDSVCCNDFFRRSQLGYAYEYLSFGVVRNGENYYLSDDDACKLYPATGEAEVLIKKIIDLTEEYLDY